MDDKTYRKTEEAVNSADKLAVTLCKVVVYRNNVYALSCKCIKIGRKGGNVGFTFARLHFRNTPLMKDDTADYLNRVGLDSDNSPHSLTANRKSVRQD